MYSYVKKTDAHVIFYGVHWVLKKKKFFRVNNLKTNSKTRKSHAITKSDQWIYLWFV